MSRNKTHRPSLAAISPCDEYLTTLKSQMPALDRLFAKLAAGATPNFLDIMAAISEMVAFHVDCDQIDTFEFSDPEKMSQKKCRFCS